mgnify:CR=1 FL=1
MNLEQQQWWSQFLTDEKGIILDVRTEEEYNRGKIANAMNQNKYAGYILKTR